jgi:glycosyltransferase involved in cell wall biosynthesis
MTDLFSDHRLPKYTVLCRGSKANQPLGQREKSFCCHRDAINSQVKPKVLHLLRSPVGGLFRHVCDLVQAQIDHGLNTGIVCDSMTGGTFACEKLTKLTPDCSLGIHRVPMNRQLHVTDLSALYKVRKIVRLISPDFIHGHGAKGGAYARLLARGVDAKSVYTPHGGSLHYDQSSYMGLCYHSFELFLKRYTDGFIFESNYIAKEFYQKIGDMNKPYRIIYNGLHDYEFTPITSNKRSIQFLFIGELRKLKGIEIFLNAVNRLNKIHNIKVMIIGEGQDADFVDTFIRNAGLEAIVSVSPSIYPARRAFTQADCVVVPSLSESLPYIVLEAAAAKVPLIASNVGGIQEILGGHTEYLVPPNDPESLANTMLSVLNDPQKAKMIAGYIHEHVKNIFALETMVSKTLEFYSDIMISH